MNFCFDLSDAITLHMYPGVRNFFKTRYYFGFFLRVESRQSRVYVSADLVFMIAPDDQVTFPTIGL